jgi:hypothetical protein
MLAKLDNCSIQELQTIGQSVQRYMQLQDDATFNVALERINQMPNIWQRLFPDRFQRIQQELTVNRMQQIHRVREQMFTLYTGVQLEIARQQGDALIASVGMDLQDRLTSFATDKINSMSETMEKSRYEFTERMKRQWSNMESFRNNFPDLAKQYENSLTNEIKTYFDVIDKLLNGFNDTLNKKISELR